MFGMIDNFMKGITKEDVNKFAKSKNVFLDNDELTFTYDFVKKNYKEMLKNPSLFKIDRYKNKYKGNNFEKIKKYILNTFLNIKDFYNTLKHLWLNLD